MKRGVVNATQHTCSPSLWSQYIVASTGGDNHSMWETYPDDYRSVEIAQIQRAVHAGECVAVVGLSGAGKSNLMGFIANRGLGQSVRSVLIDCNRLPNATTGDLFNLVQKALGTTSSNQQEEATFEALEQAIDDQLNTDPTNILCLLFDRFDRFSPPRDHTNLYANLRALRDMHKYRLVFVFATRHELPAQNELGELLHANTIWIGSLSISDARWTIQKYASRKDLVWSVEVEDELIALTGGYPSLLRGACEAMATGLEGDLGASPALIARIDEFWSDQPAPYELQRSNVSGITVLMARAPTPLISTRVFDTNTLTGKELGLLKYFQSNPNRVCEKDEIISSVWSEDRAFISGMRDDSLSQLVRRLREKIELDASNPRHIQTVPSRGYRFVP